MEREVSTGTDPSFDIKRETLIATGANDMGSGALLSQNDINAVEASLHSGLEAIFSDHQSIDSRVRSSSAQKSNASLSAMGYIVKERRWTSSRRHSQVSSVQIEAPATAAKEEPVVELKREPCKELPQPDTIIRVLQSRPRTEPLPWIPSYNPFDAQNWFYKVPEQKLEVQLDTFYHPYCLHPNSNGVQIWNAMYNCIVCFIMVFIPIANAFNYSYRRISFISLLTTVVVAIDVLFKLNVAYLWDEDYVTDRRLIFRRLLRTGVLAVDIVAGLPWVLLLQNKTLGLHLHLVLAIRLLDERDIIDVLSIKKMALRTSTNTFLQTGIQVLIWQIYYWHLASCFYTTFLKSTETGFALYTEAFQRISHRQIQVDTMTPADSYLITFNSIVTFTFHILFVTIVASYFVELDKSGKIFSEKMDELYQYNSYKHFDKSLRDELLEYYKFKYPKARYFNEHEIMKDLNSYTRKTISILSSAELIRKVPFFKNADELFLSCVVSILEPEHFVEGEDVIREGTAGDRMYFIQSGSVSVVVGGEVKFYIREGSFFGEIALLLGPMKRTATVKAVRNCVCYSLSRRELEQILEEFPIMALVMRQTAVERLQALQGNASQK
ncbi:anaphase-promoting complex subunit Hcn1 [Kappamyces sp. JEL0829]|nr:anaphase-promoting complex subunit Hcn1 [Kappamyces sp. JEL0829]